MANYQKILTAIEAAANAWLPDDYHFGYELAHDTNATNGDGVDAAPEDLALVDAGSAEFLSNWRRRLQKYAARGDVGAAADLAAWPTTGRYLIAEIVHLPTGVRAVKAYSYDTLKTLATNPNLTPAQKRAQVRNALANLYADAQARVAEVSG